MKDSEALTLLYLAASEPIGILVSTNDFERLRMKLYAARGRAQDPTLKGLQLRQSPFPDKNGQLIGGHLVIVNQKIRLTGSER